MYSALNNVLSNTKHLLTKIPEIPIDFAQAMHDLGLVLLTDDIHDIGYFTYYNRRTHIYKGKRSPHHPSPFHHWQVGLMMLIGAKVAGMMSIARDNLEILYESEMEEGYMGLENKFPERDSPDIIKFNDYVSEVVEDEPPPSIQDDISPLPKPEPPKLNPTRVKLSDKIPKLSIHL